MTLKEFFTVHNKIALGFSGGVDSSFLLYSAIKYGADIKPYFIKTAFQPEFELEDAMKLASQLNIEPEIIRVDVLQNEKVTENPKNRCYFCKNTLFSILREKADAEGRTLIDGTNYSDDAGDRPGMKALKEMNVLSPLRECKLTKVEIRKLSEDAGLFTWDKPAYACLATRIPTGTTITKDQLQVWVDYALKIGAVIIYDAAYEAYISTENVPHSIYECEGAKGCAIELRSFSKNAGFTGTRLGFTVIPKELKCGDVMLHSLWARRHGTKFNGAPYIIQAAGAAVYTDEGKKETKEQIAYYMNNAKIIRDGLTGAGYEVYGGVDAPYIWLKTPDKMTSWEFFDKLLHEANVVGTPGSGFGAHGEGYFRLSAFGSHENTIKAVERITKM